MKQSKVQLEKEHFSQIYTKTHTHTKPIQTHSLHERQIVFVTFAKFETLKMCNSVQYITCGKFVKAAKTLQQCVSRSEITFKSISIIPFQQLTVPSALTYFPFKRFSSILCRCFFFFLFSLRFSLEKKYIYYKLTSLFWVCL